ncbi:DUF5977 domain-containing protein [Spirosoma foliorum]|uniref:DUF5977 domain-containing protein n=1 Tax=Spirosoma foliorum TaxID=2710596 RepID=A0A7G5GYX9_9BACT|nr:DUF5977 domain-containing protein [Spirosoma foliorum]QMW04071.1 hypothetical protein H3H32_03690 [Spirosoma foliorum]
MIDPLKTGLVFLPVQFSRNKIEHVLDAADTSLVSRTGLRYFLEALVPTSPGSTTFKRLVKMPGAEKPPRTEFGSTVYEGAFFRLDELLDGFLEYQKPAAGTVDMCIISSLTMPYMLRESILNNGVLLAGSSKELQNQWILKAGLSDLDFATWGEVFFTTYMSQQRPFLTWQLDNKVVGEQQPEYLFYLLNMSPTPATIRRRVEITYTDGSEETLDKGLLSGGQTYQVVCVPTGAKALGLIGGAKTVASYRVWLTDGERNRLSEVRSYTLDRKYRGQERWILYSNSLGGWDTLRLTGAGSETLETLRTMAAMERPAGAPSDFSELKVVHVEGKQTLSVSTGFFERFAEQQLKCLDELLLSQNIYLLSKKGHQALELLTTTLVDAEDNADLVARSFTFQVAAPILNYSSLPVASPAPARPVGWNGIGVIQVLDEFGKRTGNGRPLKFQKYYLDDNTIFKPLTEKPNQPGDPDYIASLPLPGITAGSTPYPSQAISRATTFKRTTCTGGDIGEAALVVIAAGKYGSEIGQAEADARAEAEYTSKNTQAYADQYGSCTVAPELYTLAVPAGQWHYRVNDGNRFEVEWYEAGGSSVKIGNTWDLQGQSRPYVYPRYSNDLNFPVYSANWRFIVYGTATSSVNVKIYQNGTIRYNTNVAMNSDGYAYLGLSALLTLASMDKLYFKATQL